MISGSFTCIARCALLIACLGLHSISTALPLPIENSPPFLSSVQVPFLTQPSSNTIFLDGVNATRKNPPVISRNTLSEKAEGVGLGLIDSGAAATNGIASFLVHPITSGHNLKTILSHPVRIYHAGAAQFSSALTQDPYHAVGLAIGNGALFFEGPELLLPIKSDAGVAGPAGVVKALLPYADDVSALAQVSRTPQQSEGVSVSDG